MLEPFSKVVRGEVPGTTTTSPPPASSGYKGDFSRPSRPACTMNVELAVCHALFDADMYADADLP